MTPRRLLAVGALLGAAALLAASSGLVSLPGPDALAARVSKPLAAPTSAAPAAGPASGPTYGQSTTAGQAPRRVLVAVVPGAGGTGLRATTRAIEAKVVRTLPGTAVREVSLPPQVPVEVAVRRYERTAGVEYAEPDLVVSRSQTLTPNDPEYPRLVGLNNTGQTGGTPDADIDAPEAWTRTVGTAASVVAVIDTGVDLSHPDLRENIWTNPGELAGNGVDDDENGYVDDVHGWDFFNDDASVYDGPEDDHGTHVAGTIAGTGGNGLGVTGVSWRSRVMALKFLGPGGSGYVSDAVAALDYAVRQGVRVSNNSWGGPTSSRTLRDAIDRAGAAGHLVVAAAGNDGVNLEGTPTYPASYPSGNIVSVAATDQDDRLATFSNYGSTSVDLAAPGVRILSTLPGGAYGQYSGTSMAAPHVTGAALLLLSEDPDATVADLRSRLLDATDPVAGLAGKVATGGRLNAADGLEADPVREVSLTAGSPTVLFGATTTLTGRLTGDGLPEPSKRIVLEQRPVGTSTWTRAASTDQVTDADGAFTFAGIEPVSNTDFRARSLEEDLVPGAVSAPTRVNVRAVLTLSTPTTPLPLGRSRAVRGAVSPAHAGSVSIKVVRNGRRLRVVTRPLDSDSRYRWVFRPGARGKYTFVASWPADTDHLGARSVQRGYWVR